MRDLLSDLKSSITMPGPQTGDMRQILYMMSALPLAPTRLRKL